MVMDGATSRRALTTAMLDLASRGLIAFREESAACSGSAQEGRRRRRPAVGDAEVEAHRARNAARARPGRPRRSRSRGCARSATPSGFIEPDDLPKFGSDVADFDTALEKHVVDRGWFGEKPSKVVARWAGRGVLAIIAGVSRIVAGLNIPISGLTLIGGAAIAGGIVMLDLRPGDAGGHDVRRDDPGDAGRLPADAPEDDGAGALDAAGRRRGRARLARHARPGRRLGHGARAAGRHRGRPVERSLEDVKDGRAAGDRHLLPGLVPDSSGQPFASSGATGSGGSMFSELGHPRHRRDDVGARDDRELAGVVGRAAAGAGSAAAVSGGGGGGAGGGF